MTIEIEHGIPVSRPRRGRNGFYPYFQMEIGDSFLVPPELSLNSSYGVAREGNTRAILDQKPHRFKAGKVDGGRMRVWRVA